MLSAWLGTRVRCTGIAPLDGGMLNSVLRLQFDHDPYTAVIKLNGDGQAFTAEARALCHMRERGFPCPEVYLEDSTPSVLPYRLLLLEALPGVHMGQATLSDTDRARVERELAEAMAALHDNTRDTFGSVDEEGPRDWREVFMPDLHKMRASLEVKTRLSATVLDEVDRAIEIGESWLADQGPPTLIHGDIWAANIIVAQQDDGWHLSGVIDPSAQYADAEMELAYLRSFRDPWADFFNAYTALRPLRPGHERRWLVYWLRTYLVHVYYFGDQHYQDITAWAARKILASA
ncbi:MAG: fructosamine kinase family protein [Anaerolineae bacterium]|nr:fructosamine kinase family protein [Anaerolineae bacterium]